VVHSAAAEVRRFPPPWTAEGTDACFIVRDANRQALAYVYFEEEPGRCSAAKLLTRDEARCHRRQHRHAAGAAARAVRHQKLQSPSLARRGASYGGSPDLTGDAAGEW
jgi:hypothetical protein